MLPPDEQKLIEQAKTDQQAFGVLFDRYYPPVSNYILHRVGDLAVAQDITSITFFKVWYGLPKFRWKNVPFGAWVYRIASNEINSYYRQKKQRATSLDALFEQTGFEPPSDSDIEATLMQYQDQLAQHQDFLLIQSLLQDLPIKYREVLSLRYFEKKSILQISEITGKNSNTVKSLLARGSRKLREAFHSQRKMENR